MASFEAIIAKTQYPELPPVACDYANCTLCVCERERGIVLKAAEENTLYKWFHWWVYGMSTIFFYALSMSECTCTVWSILLTVSVC